LRARQRGDRVAPEGSSRAAGHRGIQGGAHRTRLVRLSEEAGLREPEMLADELHLLLDGARVTSQSVGTKGLATRLLHMGKAMIAAHTPRS